MHDLHDLIAFINAGPTAAHAARTAGARLAAADFTRLAEEDTWKLSPGGKFWVQRGDRSLVAVRIGTGVVAEAGFRIAGAHCDSPGLRLKPRAHYAAHGYLQMGVEVYGGPLLASWTDRDLTVAGKLILRAEGGPPRTVLVHCDRPLCRIPQVALHFNREVNKEGLKLDMQRHLPPLYGLGDKEALRDEPLLTLLAEQAGVARGDILTSELEVVDTQAASLGGISNELLFAPRIDNLAGCHAVLQALIASEHPCPATRVAVLFDSEEVGSQTSGGAGSRFLDAVLERICLQQDPAREAWHRALTRSELISVDGAHAVHPNYADYHDPHHHVQLNRGPVIKISAQQRYATGAHSRHWFEACAQQAGVSVQHYIHRTDLPCGSTIGPMTATRLGVSTSDVGNPMLAMHSIRETGGAQDQGMMIRVLAVHFGQ